MALNAAADKVLLIHRHIALAAVADQLPVAGHGDQPPPQRLHRLRVLQPQGLAQGLVGERAGGRREHLEDIFTAGDGVVVFGRFALGMGVAAGFFLAAAPAGVSGFRLFGVQGLVFIGV